MFYTRKLPTYYIDIITVTKKFNRIIEQFWIKNIKYIQTN